jgi:NAD(P)-dependent dehydrogenase (short-subunit alcohol dehydrogenase family)
MLEAMLPRAVNPFARTAAAGMTELPGGAMPTVLITGANRGLGLEFARQYAKDGWRVLACAREPGKATALGALAKGSSGKVTTHALDVADFAQVERLAREVKDPLDVLLNNAGVYARGARFGHLDYPEWERSFRVNCLAPIRMAELFVDHVALSGQRKIVNVTSLMGSIGDNESGGSYAYRSSKAALNMATVCLARDLKERGITAVVVHPGWVKTDMGGAEAPIEAPESVAGLRKVIEQVEVGDSGSFFDYEGERLPW